MFWSGAMILSFWNCSRREGLFLKRAAARTRAWRMDCLVLKSCGGSLISAMLVLSGEEEAAAAIFLA